MPTTLIDRPANGDGFHRRAVGRLAFLSALAMSPSRLPQRLRTRRLRRFAKGLTESGERLGAPLRQLQAGCVVKR